MPDAAPKEAPEVVCLEHILGLAQAERTARNSPLWKTDTEAAIEAHGDAADGLYAALYMALDARNSSGTPGSRPPAPNDLKKELKRDLRRHIKEHPPVLVSDLLEGWQ